MAANKGGPKKAPSKSGPKGGGSKGGGKPKGGGLGGKTSGPKKRFFGGHGGYKGVNVRHAERLVNGQIRDQVNTLEGEKKRYQAELDKLLGEANSEYERGTGDLKHIFDETQQYIGDRNAKIADTFTGARTQASAAKAALMQQLQNNAGAVGGQADSELARLGLGGGDFLGQFGADAANARNVAEVTSAHNDANINAMASGAASIGDLLLGMNAGSHNANQGRILNSRNDQISDARDTFNQQQMAVNDAIRQARNGRGDVLRELLVQMQQTGWAQFVDKRNLAQQNRQLNLQAQAQRFDQRMANRQFAASRQDANRSYALSRYSTYNSGGSSNGGSSGGGSSSVGSGGRTNSMPGGSSALNNIIDVLSGKPKKR